MTRLDVVTAVVVYTVLETVLGKERNNIDNTHAHEYGHSKPKLFRQCAVQFHKLILHVCVYHSDIILQSEKAV